MRNIFLFIKHEIFTTLGKRSFWIMTFLFPLLVLGLSVGMQTVGTKAIEEAEEAASSIEQTSAGLPIGYADDAGIVNSLPTWVPDGYLIAYPDREAAAADLKVGNIHQYYYIPENFFDTGEIILIDKNFQPLRSSANAEIFNSILSDVLIKKDPLGLFLDNPTNNISSHPLALLLVQMRMTRSPTLSPWRLYLSFSSSLPAAADLC